MFYINQRHTLSNEETPCCIMLCVVKFIWPFFWIQIFIIYRILNLSSRDTFWLTQFYLDLMRTEATWCCNSLSHLCLDLRVVGRFINYSRFRPRWLSIRLELLGAIIILTVALLAMSALVTTGVLSRFEGVDLSRWSYLGERELREGSFSVGWEEIVELHRWNRIERRSRL